MILDAELDDMRPPSDRELTDDETADLTQMLVEEMEQGERPARRPRKRRRESNDPVSDDSD